MIESMPFRQEKEKSEEEILASFKELVRSSLASELEQEKIEKQLEGLKVSNPEDTQKIKELETQIKELDIRNTAWLGKIEDFKYNYADGIHDSTQKLSKVYREVENELGIK